MRTFINTVGIVLTILILLTFSMENTHTVDLLYYTGIKYTFPVWGLVIIPFFLGVVIGNLLDVIQRFRLKNEIKKLKKGFKGSGSGLGSGPGSGLDKI